MVQINTLQRQTWTILYAIGTVLLTVTLALISTGLLMLFIMIALIVALVYGASLLVNRSITQSTAGRTATASNQSAPEVETGAVRQIRTATGEVMMARTIPLGGSHQNEGYQMLLTRNGFLLTNPQGRIVHTIDPEREPATW